MIDVSHMAGSTAQLRAVVAGGFAQPQYVGVTLLLVFVNVAFFGILWHAGRMVLTPAREGAARGEQSAWMVAGMLGCLFVVVALGAHLPTALSTLIGHASNLLAHPV